MDAPAHHHAPRGPLDIAEPWALIEVLFTPESLAGHADHHRPPDAALSEKRLHAQVGLPEALVLGHHQDSADDVGGGNHLIGLRQRRSHGLLAQDMLASLDCGDRHRCVTVVGQTDTDGLDVGVVERFVEAGRRTGVAALGKGRGALTTLIHHPSDAGTSPDEGLGVTGADIGCFAVLGRKKASACRRGAYAGSCPCPFLRLCDHCLPQCPSPSVVRGPVC